MFKRKFITLIFSTLLSMILIAVFFVIADGEELSLIFPIAFSISGIALPTILLYGLPISLISEKLTSSFSKIQRIFWSFLIHIFFGAIFVFIVGLLFETQTLLTNFNDFWNSYSIIFIPSIVISLFFWIVDECIRSYQSSKV